MRGVDFKNHEFSDTAANEFLLLDLGEQGNCRAALARDNGTFDEVYQLAADMGGMGFIHSAECEIMRNSALINLNMTHSAASGGVDRYFLSSSVCIYRDMQTGEPELTEEQAYPANPDNEYGWEKLYAERVASLIRRCLQTGPMLEPHLLTPPARVRKPGPHGRLVASKVTTRARLVVVGAGTGTTGFSQVECGVGRDNIRPSTSSTRGTWRSCESRAGSATES